MLSEISVPLDGFANTRQEISVALRLAQLHDCPVVGWKICAGRTTAVCSSPDFGDEYGSSFSSTPFGHVPTGIDKIGEIFSEEAKRLQVSVRIADEELFKIADFYKMSSASNIAVVSSETIRFWRTVETNAFLRGDFASYQMAPLLVLGAHARSSFQEVVFAYDGSKQAKSAFEAYAKMETRSNHSISILVCDEKSSRASGHAEEARQIVAAAGIGIESVSMHCDLLHAVIDHECAGDSVLIVAGLCTHLHSQRPRFGHLADHLIESRVASILLAC